MKETQCEMILRYMRTHGSITTFDAYDRGCTRLSARIADLKKRGHLINKTMETGKDRYGKPVTFARYSLGVE